MHTCSQRIGPPIDIGFSRVHARVYWLQSVEFEFSLKYFHAHACGFTVCAPLLSRKIVKPFRSHLFLSNHLANCPCDCDTCSEKKCRPEAMDTNWLQTSYVPRLSFFMAVNTTIIVGNVFR